MARTKRFDLQRLIEEETKVIALAELVLKSIEERINQLPAVYIERGTLKDLLYPLRQRIIEGREMILALPLIHDIIATVILRAASEETNKSKPPSPPSRT